MSMNRHPSDSTVQQDAEVELLEMLGHKLGLALLPHTVKLNDKSTVKIDGFDPTGRVLCEVYAHVGSLRGSQSDKLATDILKLNLAEARLGGRWRKIILFADQAACKQLRGSSWLAEVCRDSGVEIEVADMNKNMQGKLAGAQRKQRMVNVE
jgi:hypothetical protein